MPLLILLLSFVFAEPWLSTRYAQNCVACHSSERYNRPLKSRRCTLSCRGCHINPNGGGGLSAYGNWLSERWLKSHHIDGYIKSKALPATKIGQDEKLQAYLKTLPTSLPKQEELYNRNLVYTEKELTTQEYKNKIPLKDPYYLDKKRFSGQINYKHLYYKNKGNESIQGPMAMDISLRFRPTEEHLSFVLEQRNLNNPQQNENLDNIISQESQMQSAYILLDNLNYNTWMMMGYYQPYFGLREVDHTNLKNNYTGFSQRSRFRAISFGGSPNVPYFNLHYILPNPDNTFEQQKGYSLSLGGRFVTLGLSIGLSYWQSEDLSTTANLQKEMTALQAGIKYGPLIYNSEALYINKEFNTDLFDSGWIYSHDIKIKLWREYYISLNLVEAKLARNFKSGSAEQKSYGIKSYLLSGLEFDLFYRQDQNQSTTSQFESESIIGQIHLFF